MGERGRPHQVTHVIESQKRMLATAFGRIWAALVLEERIAARDPAVTVFPGSTEDAYLLARELSDDPALGRELAALIKAQAEQSWESMTRKPAHFRPLS
jgi:hypothetical protein